MLKRCNNFPSFVIFLFIVFSVSSARGVQENDIRIDYEVWQLSSEELGMAGWAFERSYNDHTYIALQTWMAMQGERGGFITLGFDGGYRFNLSPHAAVDAGVYLGAGGGRGGYHLSGGGLMLRPHVSVLWRGLNFFDLAAGVSYVVFPNEGTIESVQPYFQLSLPYDHAGNRTWEIDRNILSGFHSMAAVGRHISVKRGTINEAGETQRNFGLVGIEARSEIAEGFYVKVETEGAAQGNSTGYMQILGGIGKEHQIHNHFVLFGEVALGGSGGGGVSTGGGMLLDGALGVRFGLSETFYVGASGGYLHAPDGHLSGYTFALKCGYQPTFLEKDSSSTSFLPSFTHTRIRYAYQHYLKGHNVWRSHHKDENVGNIGVQLDAFINPHWYLTGQGFAAADGNAGAYMTGLLGVGCKHDINGTLFSASEVLIGAAGGGGLQMGSGLVMQLNTGFGVRITDSLDLVFQAGRLEALNGVFAATVVGVALQSELDW
jgi:hypothetical protein